MVMFLIRGCKVAVLIDSLLSAFTPGFYVSVKLVSTGALTQNSAAFRVQCLISFVCCYFVSLLLHLLHNRFFKIGIKKQ